MQKDKGSPTGRASERAVSVLVMPFLTVGR